MSNLEMTQVIAKRKRKRLWRKSRPPLLRRKRRLSRTLKRSRPKEISL